MKLQKKTEIRAEKGLRKGKEKESTWDGTGRERRILSLHHPSTLVHWWVLVHSGPLGGQGIFGHSYKLKVIKRLCTGHSTLVGDIIVGVILL